MENKINSETQKIDGLVQPLSKRALKRMKKREEWEAKKTEIKKLKKERKKERKKQQLLQNPPKDLDTNNNTNEVHIPRKERLEQYKQKAKEGIKVIIDCDFEDKMNERNIYSMSRQIADCYCTNKKADAPFNLILYNVGPLLYESLSKNHCENWVGISIYKKDEFKSFDDFVEKIISPESEEDLEKRKKKIYYLSADSENEINELEKDCTYIIGGIVDRNRYKFLSFNKANELKINHGKLPIGEYIKLSSSKVLTTNHTFSILSQFNTKHDWKESFLAVIPKRKIEEE